MAINFCPLCYGNVEYHEEDVCKCRRCGSVFEANGTLIAQGSGEVAKAAAVAFASEPYNAYANAVMNYGRAPMPDFIEVCGTCKQVIESNPLTGTSCACANRHVLYVASDADAPDSIKDRNGDITLALCKVCGRGEGELVEPCTPRKSPGFSLQKLEECHGLMPQLHPSQVALRRIFEQADARRGEFASGMRYAALILSEAINKA